MTMKKKITMIVLANTVEQGRRDRMAILEMQNSESDSGNLEIYSVSNR